MVDEEHVEPEEEGSELPENWEGEPDTPPPAWWRFHHADCGIAYRGCSPECPKDVYEKTGKWIGPSRTRVYIHDQLVNQAARFLNGEESAPLEPLQHVGPLSEKRRVK